MNNKKKRSYNFLFIDISYPRNIDTANMCMCVDECLLVNEGVNAMHVVCKSVYAGVNACMIEFMPVCHNI